MRMLDTCLMQNGAANLLNGLKIGSHNCTNKMIVRSWKIYSHFHAIPPNIECILMVMSLMDIGWQVVRKTQPRDSFEIVEQMDDDIVELGNPSQKKRKRANEVKFKMKSLKTENEGSFPSKSLLPQSSDLVKKYIKELETSSIGNGQGLINSTMSISQGIRMMHNNSMARSSNPTKVRRVRGGNMCKQVASLEIGQKLKVTFYNNRMVGTNSNIFLRNMGKIVRDRNICSLGVSSWHDIKQEKLNNMWAAVEDAKAQLEEMVQADPSVPTREIVEKCCETQTSSHIFGFGGGVKTKDLKGGTSSKAELLYALRSTREDIKSLNEENKSLNEENKSLTKRLSTL
ncbi:hypothetical protein KY285_003557 [Solanum tuberosum]|nr:hypothetical protein KY285_003557 [Solanum tuberosum]